MVLAGSAAARQGFLLLFSNGLVFYRRSQSHIQAEDCALAGGSTQRTVHLDPAILGCSVEVPVETLHQPTPREDAVGTANLGAKAVKRCFRTACGDFENRAIATRPAPVGCPVEISVSALHQASVRVGAVATASLGAKTVKRRQRTRWGDLKDRAPALLSARVGCPVEISVDALHQGCVRAGAVGAASQGAKAVKCGQRTSGGDLENRAVALRPATVGCPVEISVAA
jgi:hypothetical protein